MKSRCIFDLAAKKQQIAAIEEEAASPDFYSDRVHAQRLNRASYARVARIGRPLPGRQPGGRLATHDHDRGDRSPAGSEERSQRATNITGP